MPEAVSPIIFETLASASEVRSRPCVTMPRARSPAWPADLLATATQPVDQPAFGASAAADRPFSIAAVR